MNAPILNMSAAQVATALNLKPTADPFCTCAATGKSGCSRVAECEAAGCAPKTAAQDAIATADSYLNNAVLPTYSELLAKLRELTIAHRDMLRDRLPRRQQELADQLPLLVESGILLDRHDRTMSGDFGGPTAAGYGSAEAAERRMGC